MAKMNLSFVNSIYIFTTILILIISRIYFNFSFTLLEIFLFLSFLLLTLAILMLLPKKWNIIPSSLITLGYGTYIITQVIYNRGFSYYYRLSTALAFKNELALSIDSALELIKPPDIALLVFIILAQLIFFILFFISNSQKEYHKKYNLHLVTGVCSLVIAMIFYILFQLNLNKLNDVDPFQVYKSDYYIYDSVSSTAKFIKSFGPTTLLFRDFQTLFENVSLENKLNDIQDYLNNKSLMESNEYTGLLKDKSILIIQAESLTNAFIDPELTPTLYKLKTEGIFFENFNAPLLPGSTSDAEFMANISLVPESDGYSSAFKYVNNYFPTTLAKIFTANGYHSYAFHNCFGEFYNRTEFFPVMGYDFYDSYKLGIETESVDSVLMENMKYLLLEDPKYLGFWITFSGHQPYSTPDYNEHIAQYKEEVMAKFPTLNMEYITIMCKTMDLDRSIATFLEDTSHAGRYDDTVIVIYGDHLIKGDYLYENRIDEVSTLVGKGSISVEELEFLGTNPLIIYNTALTPKIISTVSSTLDIAPTLYNLFGLDYNQETILGNDILDPNYSGRFFTDVGYYETNNFYYDPINNRYRPVHNYSFEQAGDDIAEIDKMRQISKYILGSNYFSENINN